MNEDMMREGVQGTHNTLPMNYLLTFQSFSSKKDWAKGFQEVAKALRMVGLPRLAKRVQSIGDFILAGSKS